MRDHDVDLGNRLRELRKRQGLRLNAVAEMVGCSESMLSKIENNKGNPSLNLLHRIAEALGVSISNLFAEEEDEPVVRRAGERPVIEVSAPGQGISLEALISSRADTVLQAHIHIVVPGGRSRRAISHEGEEVGYLLEGELELEVDGQTHQLSQGDAFYFRSERKHRYRNPGTTIARVLWVNTPPTF